ncbi:MAG: hypothetical protein IKS98_12710, partial [Lachnospiraceae bacterium]|nr:hypothetical protein [Lachnospiraceae bacterium]
MIKEKMCKKLKSFGHKVCGIILTAALAIGSLTVIPGGVQAKADDSKGEKIYNDIMSMTNGEPAGYNNSTNPYGYAYDEPFFMYRPQNLAAYFNYGQQEKVSYKQYNLKGRGQYEGYFYDAAHDDYGDKGDEDWRMGYVRTVAFDPTGSGRKTWLACVGIYYGDDIWFWFYNEDGQRSKSYRLGSANWMGDSNTLADNNTKYFNSMNFISITAGDYNKDKCDSVVIYACYNHSSYSVNEITVNPEDMTCNADKAGVLDDYHHLLNEAYVNNDTIRELLSDSDNNDYIGNHLSCQLATGDVNGDGIDDLVAVSAPCRMDSKGLAWQNYAACVKVCLGSKGRTRFISQDWTGYRFVHDEAGGNDISCVAPGVSIGDIDGDGINEIVVAGIKNTIKSDSPFNVDQSKMIIAAYEYDTSINRDGYGAKRLREEDYKEVDTNAWTKDGTYGSRDNAWQVTAVECVAFEGKASPEKVFVSGDVYQWIGGSGLTKETTFNYFNAADNGSGSTTLSNTFINSVAVGNFDGNTWGYEQIVYVVGLKKDSYDEYKFTEGWGGRKYDTSTGELKEGYFSTSLSTMENHTWPDDFAYADLEDREGLNYIICPIDTKDDGILARYKGKTYTYADPQVMAIIQAAPTFGELDNIDGNYNGLNGSGSTSVSVSVSNTYGNSVGNSLSAGLGLNVSLETSVVEVNTRIGANFSWDREFSDSISDSKTYTFVAQDEDVVAVARVPVVLYTYELQVNGKWDNNFRAKSGRLTYSDQDKKENAIVLSFPQNPVYQTITLDDYNDFVKCYNKKLEDEFAAKKAAGKVSADYEPTYLTAIEDKWLGNEGNPYAYRSVNELSDDFVILQDSPVALSNTSGYTEYTTSSADTHSESDSISYGFSFELEVLAGCSVGGTGAKAGYDLALEYMTTRSSFKETTKETSYTGQVPNIVSSEAEKLPYVGTEQASRNYKFTWQLAKWDSNIVDQVADMNGNKKPETIPVIGYALSNISAPTLRVADLKTEKIDDSGKPAVRLTWSKPGDADRTTVGGYSLYQYQADGTRVKIADLPGDATEYLFDNFDGKDTYKFTISTKEGIDDTYESLESLFAYAY